MFFSLYDVIMMQFLLL